MNQFYEVSKEVKNRIINACAENNAEAFLITRLSNHKDDNFLYLVLANKKNEYVCWEYNDSTQSLNHGYRTTCFKDAMIKFSNRLHDLDYIKESEIRSKENMKKMKDINYIVDHSYVIERDILSYPLLIEIDDEELNILNHQKEALEGYDLIYRLMKNAHFSEYDEFMKGIAQNMEMCVIVRNEYERNDFKLDDSEFYASVAEKLQSTIRNNTIINLIKLSKNLNLEEIDCQNIELSFEEYNERKYSLTDLGDNFKYTLLLGDYAIHNNYCLLSPQKVYLTEGVRYIEENYQTIMNNIMKKIANRINDYMYDLDTYDYKDNFFSKEDGFDEILRQLENSEEISELLDNRFYSNSEEFKNIISNLELLSLIQNDYNLMKNSDYFKDIEICQTATQYDEFVQEEEELSL